MALFSTPSAPPDKSEGALSYVMWLAREEHGCESAQTDSAIAHDLGIYGMDVFDFVEKLAERYGAWVLEWPWDRFTEMGEGLGLLAPFALLWQLIAWPFRRRFSYRSELERLELGHVAKVLDAGKWIEP